MIKYLIFTMCVAAGVAVAGAAGAGNQSVPSFFIFMTFSDKPGIKSPPFWEAYKYLCELKC
ncbi:MAG: hypothetical protein WA364_30045 [Candidatus Nitrosopolaris sp.]